MPTSPEELNKWTSAANKITASTAVIMIAGLLLWQTLGDRNQAIYAARASAEESVAIVRTIKEEFKEHSRMTSEDSSVLRMLLIQICVNTADRDRQAINQCLNYREMTYAP